VESGRESTEALSVARGIIEQINKWGFHQTYELFGANGAAATYTWDVNGDGTFGDATGATPTLTWAQLEALGIDDGPSSHVITLRVTSGAQTATDTAMLQVTNVGPSARVSYNTDVRVGVASAFGVQAADASSADMAATFTYVVDWGDGSDLQTVSGSADISML